MTCKEEGHRKKHHDASQAYFFVTGFPFGFRLHEHDGSSASRAIPKGGPDRPCHPVRPTKNMKEDLLWAHGVFDPSPELLLFDLARSCGLLEARKQL